MKAVEWPQVYRLSDHPAVDLLGRRRQVLAAVDRRTPCGRRDYAILLLLVTYGLRAREVAAMTLDDIDWKRERLAIPERKAGHSTAFPLSQAVGEALADYLSTAGRRPRDRHVFFRAMAPLQPLGSCRDLQLRPALPAACRGRRYPPGVAHPAPQCGPAARRCRVLAEDDRRLRRAPLSEASTQIYAKVAIEPLRQVALGDGEEALR